MPGRRRGRDLPQDSGDRLANRGRADRAPVDRAERCELGRAPGPTQLRGPSGLIERLDTLGKQLQRAGPRRGWRE